MFIQLDKHSPIDLAPAPKANSETVTQWVYNTLREAVLAGHIMPGRALTIRELAGLLGVSPMPIREALRQLSAEGALEIQDNRRVLVPRMTAVKFTELVDARIVLESHSASRALPYISPTIVKELRRLDAAINAAHDSGHDEDVLVLNQAFHRTIYSANPHQVTLPLIERLWLQLAPFMRVATTKLEQYYKIDRHQEALDAISRSDPLALQLAISADIRDGCAFAQDPELLQEMLHV